VAPTEFDPWRGGCSWVKCTMRTPGHLAQSLDTRRSVRDCGLARRVRSTHDADSRRRTGVVKRSTLETFISRRTEIPGSLPRAGNGTRCSPLRHAARGYLRERFGHTGFTGTSLWIDPELDVYIALLTNRVHPTRTNEAIKLVRPALQRRGDRRTGLAPAPRRPTEGRASERCPDRRGAKSAAARASKSTRLIRISAAVRLVAARSGSRHRTAAAATAAYSARRITPPVGSSDPFGAP
jgi:hypothetical protein